MLLDPLRVAKFAWVAVGVLWMAMAFTNKQSVRRMPYGALLLHGLALWLCFCLIFTQYFRVGFLRARFVPADEGVRWLGCATTLGGLAFIVWARFRLGTNWSGTVQVKEGHTLVRSGPYALVRHPIYTGLSLALVGTAVIYGEVRCLLGAVLAFFEWKRKSLMEERFMIEEFGQQYLEYRRDVKGLIPFVW
jgi:protein-S-isoprenylcysteine O-methyltransferase Ste14